MIEIDQFDIFINHITTLKETSKDDSDRENIQYMTESLQSVVDFDLVKRQYLNTLGLSEENADSVDALAVKEEKIFMIEFKNGNMKNEKRKVKTKIRDSLLLFCDITKNSIEFTRKNVEFILVYNESKNSKSRANIAKHLAEKSSESDSRFNMERFNKLYFKNVYTYTESEFQENFVDVYASLTPS